MSSAMGFLLGADPALGQPSLTPSAAFVQIGTYRQTQQVTLGVTRSWDRDWAVGAGHLTGYWEASASKWSYPAMDGHGSTGLGQLGLIPVLRYRPGTATSGWFAEIGIGATVTTVIYDTKSERFSTRFNFGDHLSVGHSFGTGGQDELSLRVEHFSNGDIRQPNPGATFAQLRYTHHFGNAGIIPPAARGSLSLDRPQ
jgi:hypothetical protein